MVAASKAALSTDASQAPNRFVLIIIILVNCLGDHHKIPDFLQENNKIIIA